jgi:transcriptional regulator with XRE-family HTH domain
MLGLTQQKLAASIGLTFQQLQKYERGANRIGASRLLELSQVLRIPVSFFFEDTDPVRAEAIPKDYAEFSPVPREADPLAGPEAVELATAFHSITHDAVRRELLNLARALVSPDMRASRGRPRRGPKQVSEKLRKASSTQTAVPRHDA